MTANSLFLVISVVSFIGSLAFHTACVRWGLRWAKVADTSYWKALGILFLFVIAGVVGASIAGAVLFGLSVAASDRAIDVVSYVGQVIASCFVIVLLMKVRLWRAALAVIPYNAATLAAMAIVVYVIRPYGYEAFSIPTNAMAPTILGVHVKAPCPRCGQPAYGPPLEPRQSLPLEGLLMNCSAEHRAVFVKDVPQKVLAGDRILSCKFISPRRWDLIVFRYPKNPSIHYVKRLVGLPDEELAIRDGSVWINGKKLDPPESLKGIHYSPTIEEHGRVFSGPGSAPLKLGPDEYFVLGDFPERSADSRFWEKGAPGYPPYAVPEPYITGVVINIYWPPERWTSFR